MVDQKNIQFDTQDFLTKIDTKRHILTTEEIKIIITLCAKGDAIGLNEKKIFQIILELNNITVKRVNPCERKYHH